MSLIEIDFNSPNLIYYWPAEVQPLDPVDGRVQQQALKISAQNVGSSTYSFGGSDSTAPIFSNDCAIDEMDVCMAEESEEGFGFDETTQGEEVSSVSGYDNVISASKGNKIYSPLFGGFSPKKLLEKLLSQALSLPGSACFIPGDEHSQVPVYFLPEKGYFAELELLVSSRNKKVYRVLSLECEEEFALGIAKKTEKNLNDLENEIKYNAKLAELDPARQFFVHGATAEIEIEGVSCVLFLMPFMRGGSLEDYLTVNEQATLEERLEIFSNMLGSVQILHRQGDRHGDLKLANFLIGENPRLPLLSDFGTTNVASPEVMAALNDPKIRSAEHANFGGFQVGLKADIWALGVIAAEMFGASFNKVKALAEAVIDRNEALVREKADAIIRKVASKTILGGQIVSSCLKVDPEERMEISALRRMIDQSLPKDKADV